MLRPIPVRRPRGPPANGTAVLNRPAVMGALALALLATIVVAGITALSVVSATTGESSRRRDRRLQAQVDALEALVANLTCNCTAPTNVTVDPQFPDDEFAVFSALDPTKAVMLDASTNLDPGSTVLWTSQNVSGTVAYLSDTSGISGNFTPAFSSLVRYTGVPTTSQMDFFQVGNMVTVEMTIFGISSPAGSGVNSVNFDLPIAPAGGTFTSATIVGFGCAFRASTMNRDPGFVIQVTGTALVQWKSNNIRMVLPVAQVIPLRFTYRVS